MGVNHDMITAILNSERMVPQLTWTAEWPTVPGWYWVRGIRWESGMPILEIRHSSEIDRRWQVEVAGPIPEPAEPGETGGGV